MECNKLHDLAHMELQRTQRNRNLRQHTLRPPEVFLKEIIKDISISFRPALIGDHVSILGDQLPEAEYLVTQILDTKANWKVSMGF